MVRAPRAARAGRGLESDSSPSSRHSPWRPPAPLARGWAARGKTFAAFAPVAGAIGPTLHLTLPRPDGGGRGMGVRGPGPRAGRAAGAAGRRAVENVVGWPSKEVVRSS